MDKQGKPILVCGLHSNGSDVQAGIITRDWNPDDKTMSVHHINATIFPDCATPYTRGSINYYVDEPTARRAYAEMTDGKVPCAWLVDTSVSHSHEYVAPPTY